MLLLSDYLLMLLNSGGCEVRSTIHLIKVFLMNSIINCIELLAPNRRASLSPVTVQILMLLAEYSVVKCAIHDILSASCLLHPSTATRPIIKSRGGLIAIDIVLPLDS